VKSFKVFIIFLILGLSVAAQARVFVIKKGNHYASGLHAAFFINHSMSFKAKFDDSAEYYLGNVNQYDVNKLYGFSDCGSAHHTNSARFGFVWNDQTLKLEIHAYAYASGSRNMKFISNVSLNQSYDYKIVANKYSYDFTVNGKTVNLPRGCKSKNAVGYKLYPYFGGDEVAPHDMKIEVND
jgi:hypothetical protein